jgi:hypothetical protein
MCGRKKRRAILYEAAQALVTKMNSETLFMFAGATIRALRPDAGLTWSEVAVEIHSACRGNALECASCPYKLDSEKLYERMCEHVRYSEWETKWNVVDEMRTHEEIHCRPCPHWGKGRL